MTENIIPGAEPEEEEKQEAQEVIQVPAQVKYGICIFETTDEVAEPIIHVHAPNEYSTISVGHLLRLLIGATKNLEAEMIYQKFQFKAAQNAQAKGRIIKPGG